MPPSGTVAGLFRRRLTPGVVGVTANLVVLGPRWDQPEFGQTTSHPACLVAFDDNRGSEARIGLCRVLIWQFHAEPIFHPLGTFGWSEICTHSF